MKLGKFNTAPVISGGNYHAGPSVQTRLDGAVVEAGLALVTILALALIASSRILWDNNSHTQCSE